MPTELTTVGGVETAELVQNFTTRKLSPRPVLSTSLISYFTNVWTLAVCLKVLFISVPRSTNTSERCGTETTKRKEKHRAALVSTHTNQFLSGG